MVREIYADACFVKFALCDWPFQDTARAVCNSNVGRNEE